MEVVEDTTGIEARETQAVEDEAPGRIRRALGDGARVAGGDQEQESRQRIHVVVSTVAMTPPERVSVLITTGKSDSRSRTRL